MATTVISGKPAIGDNTIYWPLSTWHPNYGASTWIQSGMDGIPGSPPTGGYYRGVMKFDASLIPPGTVDELRWTFAQWRHSSSGGTALFYKILVSFVEGTAAGWEEVGSCDWLYRERATLAWNSPGMTYGVDYQADASPPSYVVPTGSAADAWRTVVLDADWAADARDAGIPCRIFVHNAYGEANSYRLLWRSSEHTSPPFFEADVSAVTGHQIFFDMAMQQ